MSRSRPKLIVFDLDYTLWPFWVDTHVRSPIRKDKESTRLLGKPSAKTYGDGLLAHFWIYKMNNHIVDGSGQKIKPYPDVPEILEELKSEGYTLGVASRTEWPAGARQLLKLFDWDKYFTYKEIYPGRKTTHFQRMHEASGIDYSDMMFFDDEMRNISDLKAVGVTSILVPDGINKQIMKDSFKSFKQK